MKRPLLNLALLAYIGLAVYSIGRISSSASARPAAKIPTAATPRVAPRVTPRVMLTSAHLPALANFYNEVFAADLQPVATDEAGVTFNYAGRLNGMDLLLSPSTKGKAERRRQPLRVPLRVEVADIAATLARVVAAGGSINGKLTETAREKRIAVNDPDGNPLELIQTNIEQ